MIRYVWLQTGDVGMKRILMTTLQSFRQENRFLSMLEYIIIILSLHLKNLKRHLIPS